MSDIMSPAEQMLEGIAPLLLAVPGGMLVLAGLFYWLGGLRLLKPLAVFTAVGVGLACAMLFTDRQLVSLLCFILIPAVIGLFLEKPIVCALGGVLTAAVILTAVFASDAALRRSAAAHIPPAPQVEGSSILDVADLIEQLTTWAQHAVKTCWQTIPLPPKIAAAGVGIGVFLAGLFAWRWVCAMTCSMLGTAAIVAGMFLLLMSKGRQAVSYVIDRMPYLAMTIAGMFVLGVLLNRWLCPAKAHTKSAAQTPPVQGDKK